MDVSQSTQLKPRCWTTTYRSLTGTIHRHMALSHIARTTRRHHYAPTTGSLLPHPAEGDFDKIRRPDKINIHNLARRLLQLTVRVERVVGVVRALQDPGIGDRDVEGGDLSESV